MLFFACSTILISITSLTLGFFVYFRDKSNLINKTWLVMSIMVTFWSLGLALMVSSENLNTSLFFQTIQYIGCIFIPPAYLHFVVSTLTLNKKFKPIVLICYGYASIILIIFFTGGLLKTPQAKYAFNFYATPNRFYLFYVLEYVLMTGFGASLVLRQLSAQKSIQTTNLKYILFASIFGFIGGSTTFFPVYNLYHPYLMYTNSIVILYPILISIAILKHNLMNINIIVKKTFVYSTLITLITTIYFLIVYIIEKWFSLLVGYHSIPLAIAVISFFSLIFNPLKSKIQFIIDKYFFHGSIDQIDEENTKLRDELEKSERLKSVATLAAGMAHEIKNPLTSIKTFTEYIDKKKNDPDFLDKFKEVVGPEVDRINHIVKQLLEFSKPSELELKDTDINQLLNETLDLLNNNLITRNIKINKHFAQLPIIQTDPNQIKQVFLNLLLNAIETINTNGTITVNTYNMPHVTCRKQTVSVTIKDSGKGIAANDLKKIFDPFFTKKDSGTGLGLSVVHGIIEKHHGKITVSSVVGEGTEFVIEL